MWTTALKRGSAGHLTTPCNSPRGAHGVQVATDTRLWLYNQLLTIRGALQELIRVAADRAEAEADVLMPGARAVHAALWEGRATQGECMCGRERGTWRRIQLKPCC